MNKKICLLTSSILAAITFSAFAEETVAPATAEAAAAPAAEVKEQQTPFAMATNAFLDAGALPVLYTCDGKNVSPQLSWTNAPAQTKAYALIMSDKDAPNGEFYHWVVFNIPQKVDNFPEGLKNAPTGADFGTNSYKKQEYNGPCPPKGSAHTYFFKLYALDEVLKVPNDADAAEVMKAMEKHIVGKTELSAVYSRWINS